MFANCVMTRLTKIPPCNFFIPNAEKVALNARIFFQLPWPFNSVGRTWWRVHSLWYDFRSQQKKTIKLTLAHDIVLITFFSSMQLYGTHRESFSSRIVVWNLWNVTCVTPARAVGMTVVKQCQKQTQKKRRRCQGALLGPRCLIIYICFLVKYGTIVR